MDRLRTASILALALAACAHVPNAKEREMAVNYNDLAADALRGGRMPEALREYDEALKLDPNLADAHRGKGVVLEFGFQRKAEAEAEYRRAIELRPAFPEAHNDLGRLLAQGGRYDEAIAEFDAAAAIMQYREPWVARCNKAETLWRMGRKPEGLAEMRACLSFQPRYCQGWRELGRMQLSDGRTSEAVTSEEEYARLCATTADAHYQLGVALLKAGQAERARESFARCAELGSNTPVGDDCRKSGERLK